MYDCKLFLPTTIILIPIAVFGFGIYCCLNLNNPFVISVKRIFALGFICMLLSIIVILTILFSYIQEYRNVFLEYKNGNYEEIEGYVSQLRVSHFLDSGADSFKINNKEFDLGIDFGVGYKKGAAYGGIINRNGLYVKIKYIPYKGNLRIMNIRVIDKGT